VLTPGNPTISTVFDMRCAQSSLLWCCSVVGAEDAGSSVRHCGSDGVRLSGLVRERCEFSADELRVSLGFYGISISVTVSSPATQITPSNASS
jgi:hypothetical protein